MREPYVDKPFEHLQSFTPSIEHVPRVRLGADGLASSHYSGLLRNQSGQGQPVSSGATMTV
jgi:hypothetical protein